MPHRQNGLLKVSVKSFVDCLRTNTQYQVSSLVLVLMFSLAGAALAAMDPATQPAVLASYGLHVMAFFLMPQEFLLYDVILGKEQPRGSLLMMCFDGRLLRYAWRYCVAVMSYILPGVLVAAAIGWFWGWSNDEPLRMALVILLAVVAVGGVLSLALRLMFFPIFVALRHPKALTASFRAMKGNVLRTVRAMLLPYSAMVAVYLLMSTGAMLAGKVDVLMGSLLAFAVACLMIILTGVETALLALVYKRIFAPKEEEGGSYASASFAEAPEAMTTHDAGEAGGIAG